MCFSSPTFSRTVAFLPQVRARLPAALHPGHVSVSKQTGDVFRVSSPKHLQTDTAGHLWNLRHYRYSFGFWTLLQKTLEEKFIEGSSNALLLHHWGSGFGVGLEGQPLWQNTGQENPEASAERRGPRGSHQGEPRGHRGMAAGRADHGRRQRRTGWRGVEGSRMTETSRSRLTYCLHHADSIDLKGRENSAWTGSISIINT